jgi:tocopherol O-methyltransferase
MLLASRRWVYKGFVCMVILDSPEKDTIRKFYDIGSPYYAEIYGRHIHDGFYITGNESRAEAQENLIRYLVEKSGVSKGVRVLDVGSGVGGGSIWLAKNLRASTVGITISPVQMEMARASAQKEHADSVFSLMDAEKMSFDKTFDVMWAIAVCTHFENQQRFIRLATDYLDRGGAFIIFDWMLTPESLRLADDKEIASIRRGMLLQSMHTLLEYQAWFISNGYNIVHSADITTFTIKTWDDAVAAVRQPAVWKLATRLALKEGKEVFAFVRSLRAMKSAMQKHKVIAGVVIARKN